MSYHLQEEIASQADVMARMLLCERAHIMQIVANLPPFQYVVIAARGSSDHAATYARYVWEALAGYPVALAAPSVYTLYHDAPRLDGALVIGISQSGQSPDIVAVVEAGKRQGRPTVAITNDARSPLALAADHVVELHAGMEQSVAATKTYTAQLGVIAAFAASWCGEAQRWAELEQVPAALQQELRGVEQLTKLAELYRSIDRCVLIGRGYNYATAFELALKLKELTYIMATPYSSADFRHGPIAMVDRGDPVLLVMPAGAALDDLRDLAGMLQERHADLLVISDSDAALSLATTPLPLTSPVAEWLSPITAVVPGQAFALGLALAKGLNPDGPRGLHKVTRTL